MCVKFCPRGRGMEMVSDKVMLSGNENLNEVKFFFSTKTVTIFELRRNRQANGKRSWRKRQNEAKCHRSVREINGRKDKSTRRVKSDRKIIGNPPESMRRSGERNKTFTGKERREMKWEESISKENLKLWSDGKRWKGNPKSVQKNPFKRNKIIELKRRFEWRPQNELATSKTNEKNGK